jgi:hypothetical protein
VRHIFQVKTWSTSAGKGVFFGALDIYNGLRLLGSHRKGTLVTLTTEINFTSLHGNIACCIVAFASSSNISILIGKQIFFRLTLADYQVPIQFKVKCMRFCDIEPSRLVYQTFVWDRCIEIMLFCPIFQWYATFAHSINVL